MTVHNHLCKMHQEAISGTQDHIPYEDIDLQMVELVRDLNTVPGMRTIDSCFGHAGSGIENKGTQTEAYVGVMPTDAKKFDNFWRTFFEHAYGKQEMATGFVQLSLIQYLYDPIHLTRLIIDPEHDTSIDPRGVQEKKDGIGLMRSFIHHYLKEHVN